MVAPRPVLNVYPATTVLAALDAFRRNVFAPDQVMLVNCEPRQLFVRFSPEVTPRNAMVAPLRKMLPPALPLASKPFTANATDSPGLRTNSVGLTSNVASAPAADGDAWSPFVPVGAGVVSKILK